MQCVCEDYWRPLGCDDSWTERMLLLLSRLLKSWREHEALYFLQYVHNICSFTWMQVLQSRVWRFQLGIKRMKIWVPLLTTGENYPFTTSRVTSVADYIWRHARLAGRYSETLFLWCSAGNWVPRLTDERKVGPGQFDRIYILNLPRKQFQPHRRDDLLVWSWIPQWITQGI